MENDRELRNVILILLQACEKWQLRALSMNSALTWIAALPPNTRAALTPEQIGARVANFREEAYPIVEKHAAQLTEALSGDKPFLPALQIYASQQFWPGH
jgi:hypothetical protein